MSWTSNSPPNLCINMKHLKSYSIFLVIREPQIKTTVRYPYTLTWIKKKIPSVGKDVEQLAHPYNAGRNVVGVATGNWYSQLKNSLAVSYKGKHILTHNSTIPCR